MAKKYEKSMWIHSIAPEIVDGETYIPTEICYDKNEGKLVGQRAHKASMDGRLVNLNFKLDIGKVKPGGAVSSRLRHKCEDDKERTSYEICKDYFEAVIKNIEGKLPKVQAGLPKLAAKIIVAEPLAFQFDKFDNDWISNYRGNIKRILSNFEEIAFLPEPFAVYQYYRYGLRVSSLQEKKKQIAFIVDFGGGTFDVCVIESTEEGDVSQAGKHSKPLSADSVPIGGFYINRSLAHYLLKRDLVLNIDKTEADKAFKQLKRIESKTDELKLDEIREKHQKYILNLLKLERSLEKSKVDLVGKISVWSLTGDAYERVSIRKPDNPFEIAGNWGEYEFFAHQFREVFRKDIWTAHLKGRVANVLNIAKDSLEDKQITISLISGGSANILWLQELLMSEFSDELEFAEPVPISHSFQEVVANGLAIECARRYYNSESEFIAVTYNPIRLFLQSDDGELQTDIRYRSIGDRVDMSSAKPGDLIPTAQTLKNFFDEPLQWKFKFKKTPNHYLHYFFNRTSESGKPDYYNIDNRVVTHEKRFDSQVVVQTICRSDGTVIPKFIYKQGNEEGGVSENSEGGKPFYIDMTSDGDTDRIHQAYVGFDFGTSNSAVCTLSETQIKITKKRSQDETWRGLSDSISSLPFPIANPLKRYLAEKSEADGAAIAREVFEACLTFVAYSVVAGLEDAEKISKAIGNMQHRSMGPLKDIIQTYTKYLSEDSISYNLANKCVANIIFIDSASKQFTDHKHEKLASSAFDYQHLLEKMIRLIVREIGDLHFGYCKSCSPLDFSGTKFGGQFVCADDNPPFIKSISYQSTQNIHPSLAILWSLSSGKAICLTPLYFWADSESSSFPIVSYVYDKNSDSKGVLYKPAHKKAVLTASDITPMLEVVAIDLKNKGCFPMSVFSISKSTT